MITLDATKRDIPSDLDSIREEGFIPAVFYGRKEASTPITIKETDFIKAFREVGESSVLTLSVGGENHDALVHEVSKDAVTGRTLHVDFYVIEKGKKVQVNVPINFVGVAPAQKDLGGILVKVIHDLPIEAEAKNLPHEIDIDISSLVDFDARILAKDIKLPAGVSLDVTLDEIIALVTPAKEEVEEATPVDVADVELSEKKGKKEEEGSEASA